MKLAYLINDSFQAALTKLNNAPLPIKEAYLVKGLSKQIKDEYDRFEQARIQSFSKYGKKDKSGGLVIDETMKVVLDETTKSQFMQEFNDLLDTEVDIPKINLEISKLDDVRLSAADLEFLELVINFQ